MKNIISFPGLGIGRYEIDPTAFTLFGVEIKWYGIIITCGILFAFFYVLWRAKYEKIKSDHIYDLAIFVILFGVVGARLYYVAFEPQRFHSFWDIINLRSGGLAIYGGIIAGALAAFVVSKIKKIDPRILFDMLAPAVMMAQAIGRWGNFMNAEAYGIQTDLPWRMVIETGYSTVSVHPIFLYESLWNLIGFIAINLFYKKKRYNGQIVLLYATWYGLGRFWIEGIRGEDTLMIGNIRVSQAVAGFAFVAGLCALIVCGTIAAKRKKEAAVEKSAQVEEMNTTESEDQEHGTDH